MQTANENPSTIAGIVQAIAIAALGLIAYYRQMTPEEMALWAALVAALCVAIQYWVSQRTVALSKLQGDDGEPVTPASVRGGQRVSIVPTKAKAG